MADTAEAVSRPRATGGGYYESCVIAVEGESDRDYSLIMPLSRTTQVQALLLYILTDTKNGFVPKRNGSILVFRLPEMTMQSDFSSGRIPPGS